MPANCIRCSATANSTCFKCNNGFFLSSGSCSQCSTGCLLCPSSSFCTSAGAGFYLIPNQDGSNSGRLGTCRSPCSTCIDGNNICTSCITGYTLNGTSCKDNNNIVLNVVFFGSGSQPIVSNGSGASNNLATGMAQINRIRFTMCSNLPSANFGVISTQQQCIDIILIVHIAGGSITVNSVVSGGNYSSAAAANSGITNAFVAGTPLDGISVGSVTVSASGYTASSTSSSGGANLGLILGLSIPLLLLCTYFLT